MTTIPRHLHTYAVLAQRTGNAAWSIHAARLIFDELPEDLPRDCRARCDAFENEVLDMKATRKGTEHEREYRSVLS